MKYRAEIDGLRALAVVPVIMFHAGFELFSGGFVGVDVFFVISGYLISTILIEDIEKKRFSIVNFYERRVRRILPALFFVLFITTIFSYFILFPSDFKDYSESLFYVVIFVSNIYFWRDSNYFSQAAELNPLLHTWSLAVEEQFYVVFPLFLILAWRYGKHRVFWMIVVMAAISFLLSEWGWRNTETANFYLAPTRAWELFAGSIAAFIVQKQGVQKNNLLALIGISAIVFSVFSYDETTPFPSAFALVPVIGVVLLLLYADKETLTGKLLGTKALVGVGLISYSAYLWHQPLFALYRQKYSIDLDFFVQSFLIGITFCLAIFSWKFIEKPFRDKTFSRKIIFTSSFLAGLTLIAISSMIFTTNGASYRFDLIPKPVPWVNVKCHGIKKIAQLEKPIEECLGASPSPVKGDIYLLGDSHAAQLTFALEDVAKQRNVGFYFINDGNFPQPFYQSEVVNNPSFEHLLKNMTEGDYLILTFHRGHLNPSRDKHYTSEYLKTVSQKSALFSDNLEKMILKFKSKKIKIFLIKDGPLLNESDNSVEKCLYEFIKNKKNSCSISFTDDDSTRYLQNQVFENLDDSFDFVSTLDYSSELYFDGYFSPISENGDYLMFDRHHLTKKASLSLVTFFNKNIKFSYDLE